MVESTHKDPAKSWLVFFFVCFTCTVFAIGVWALLMYHVDDTNPPAGSEHPAAGGHGMILPEQAPHRAPSLLS